MPICTTTSTKKIVAALCILNLTDCIAIFILNLLGIADYNENNIIVLLLFAVCLFYIGAATIQRMIKYKKRNIYHNIGVIIVTISVLLDVIATRINPQVESSSFMILGIAAFSCLECIQVMVRFIDINQKALRAQIVGRLAYYDGLTDLLNRTSFQEDMDRLEKEPSADTLIAMFDINELKYVNDNFGHASGDDLIIHVADAIRNAFGSMGKCYRIGGDEMVLISTCENAELKYAEAKNTLDKLIAEANNRTEYPVSVAVGYSVTHGRAISLKELLDEADEKMYAKKRKMKEEKAAHAG